MIRFFFFGCFLLCSSFLFSQQAKIDSLKAILSTTSIDTVKLNSYYALTSMYGEKDTEVAQKYLDTMMTFAKSKKLKKYELTGYSQQGILYFRKNKTLDEVQTWKNALLDKDIDKYPTQKGNYFNNIAVGYKALRINDSVIDYFMKSMELNEKLNNTVGLIANYYSI